MEIPLGSSSVLVIWPTSIPGLVEAVLCDNAGAVVQQLPELTMGQVTHLVNTRGLGLRRADG